MSDEQSEFGDGFLYPLALFLAHADQLGATIERYEKLSKTNPMLWPDGDREGASMWLYAAADHMYGFKPERAPEHLRQRCEALRDEALEKRLPMHGEEKITKERAIALIDEAKALFLELDRHFGNEPIEADYA